MQFKTKSGLMAAAREIAGDEVQKLHTSANRVSELFSSQYMRAHDDGGRVAHAMKQLREAVSGVSALWR